jgi:surface protein
MGYMFAAVENTNRHDIIQKRLNLRPYKSSFQGIGLDTWNTSQVNNMKSMFQRATSSILFYQIGM